MISTYHTATIYWVITSQQSIEQVYHVASKNWLKLQSLLENSYVHSDCFGNWGNYLFFYFQQFHLLAGINSRRHHGIGNCDNYVKTKQSCHLIVILTKLEIVSALYQSQQ